MSIQYVKDFISLSLGSDQKDEFSRPKKCQIIILARFTNQPTEDDVIASGPENT